MSMTKLWFKAALLPQGWSDNVRIEVRNGLIASLEVGQHARPGDDRHGYGLPGLPNLHSHAFQRAMAGRAEQRGGDGDTFWSWRTQMYRLAQRVRPDDLEAIAALAFAEMLEAGFVHVGEFHYVHHDVDGRAFDDPGEMAAAVVQAAEQTGIGLTLLPVFYAQSGFGGGAPTPQQRRFIHDIEGFARLLERCAELIRPLGDACLGVAPHSLRAVAPDDLLRVAAMAPDGPVHIHIAEQRLEVEDCVAWSGQRPVSWLLDHAEVGPRWCLVHATHVTSAEVAAIASRGAVVGLCPITEANLGDGIFPASDLLARGGAFGIGSDSNVLIDPAEELRLLEYGQRLSHGARNVLADGAHRPTADWLFDGARLGGSQALGVVAGELSAGAPATFLSLDTEHPSMCSARPEEILSRWVFAARAPIVESVWRCGHRVVAGGRHVARPAILVRYRAAIARLVDEADSDNGRVS
jgi:formimidoylglutamate deiminase